MESASFAAYHQQVFTRGMEGDPPPFPTEPEELVRSARQRLGAGPYAYLAGSAGAGRTDRANLAAFDRWAIVPRMLTGARTRDLRTTVLGTEMPAPVLVGPVGVQSILHPDGELATAAASADLGLTSVMSTMSSFSIEEVAQAAQSGPRWFQLYWPDDDEIAASILARARRAGFTVLVVTVDTMSVGWRPAIVDLGYLPMLRGTGNAVLLSDPVFRSRLARPPEQDMPAAVRLWGELLSNASRRWEELPFLRRHWDGPIVLKGIQHVDDARAAADFGLDGIVVSNHGGRQVDGAVASLDVLPEIVAAVGDRLTVLFDSGVRTGADIVKALALGAEAVLIGRPYAYGLAHGGRAGVTHVLRSLLGEFDLTLGLAGHHRPAALDRAALRPVSAAIPAGLPDPPR